MKITATLPSAGVHMKNHTPPQQPTPEEVMSCVKAAREFIAKNPTVEIYEVRKHLVTLHYQHPVITMAFRQVRLAK